MCYDYEDDPYDDYDPVRPDTYDEDYDEYFD